MKILQRSDKDEITFKAVERYQYGLRKTSQHINFQKWHNLEILQILVASIGFLVVGRYFELQVTF